jgi:hypothetical protein
MFCCQLGPNPLSKDKQELRPGESETLTLDISKTPIDEEGGLAL